jgi:hypothetical protein
MDQFPSALPHGQLEQVFPDIFFVTGAMKTMLMNAPFQFSRNMTAVRAGDALTLINSIRLDDAGLAQLDALGRVTNVVKIGSLHGRDDAFYKARYGATFWAAPGMVHERGLVTDRELRPEDVMPFAGCSVFDFRTTKMPECILHVDRAGGILIACDSLQNLVAPDEYFSDESRQRMQEMGFFQPANLGPVWRDINEPRVQDFIRLQDLSFRHVLCGHGPPLRDTAKEAYTARFRREFGAGQPGVAKE